MGLHVQAQKFLDFYYQGSVVSSVNASDIDSMVIGTNPTNRTVDLYKNGDIFHSTTAARVDSVKVFKPENAPLVYLGIIGFNQELYKKEFGILSTSTASGFNTFVGNLTCKDGTLLYYGVDKALDMLKSTSFPTQVSSVNLVTFTDGLDQGSMMMNGSYTTDEQYLNAVHQLIVNTRVKGLPLTAYSLGLKGSDVTNYTLFQNNLTKLASSSDKAIEVSSMSAVRTRLQEISDQIISISNKQTVSMKIPGPSNGTIIRFTFDNATAANSSMYIEGTFNLSDRSLRNVKYYGINGGSGTIVQGKQEGIFVTYTFSGLQRTDGNGLIPVNSIREFYRSSTTNTWQENSEFTPANNTQTNITHSGAIILLVLDCSSSLGSQFSNMKSYAQDFITRVANNAEPYERLLSPTNVKASIDENDLVVNVSWNGVKYAESYNVYRSSSSNGTYELVAEGVTSTTWTDSSPLSGSNYYKVCAVNRKITSSQSPYASVTVNLAAPTNVKAVIDENDLVVNVSWDAVKYAQSYKVYRCSSSSGTYSFVAEGVTSTTWKDESPKEGYNYYKVCAEGYGFTSSQSSYASVKVSLALSTPTNIKAEVDVKDENFVVNVSWDAVKYAQSYDVYRSNSSDGTYELVAENISSTIWTDISALYGNSYYYIVRAKNRNVVSTQSPYASVTVNPAAPTHVKAVIDENDLVVNVSWDAVKYAESYNVYRCSSPSGTYSLIAERVTSTSWTDNNPLNGNNYYKVNTLYKDKISALSNAVRALDPTKGSIITVNGVAFNMVKVSGGTFQMGATSEQGSDAESDEKPVHQVTLSDYYIGETEVTQELWQAVMGSNPSGFTGSGLLPVERVSWDDCQTFITKLNALTGMQFRLPTEAEWEFAARGGNSSQGYKYSGSNNIVDVAWYTKNSNSKTHEVGTKAPNELGLYDMSGNVWEWWQDWYDYYSSSAQTNPTGPTSGYHHMHRGGSWYGSAGNCRVSRRKFITPYDGVGRDHGLRLAL